MKNWIFEGFLLVENRLFKRQFLTLFFGENRLLKRRFLINKFLLFPCWTKLRKFGIFFYRDNLGIIFKNFHILIKNPCFKLILSNNIKI